MKLKQLVFVCTLYILLPRCHMKETNIDRSISRHSRFGLNNFDSHESLFLHNNRTF